ncbi:hypothetical protein NDU88_001676 [Pleurodeles waltl]|uniref:Uncharacterized protein n=1 Tax=Pleurodeles waltl TaxID=8319 RepID=A0AAV7NBF6_PLEWA|nr:hypothetical protein NDU88_001676 [Pleurodeles waltl]
MQWATNHGACFPVCQDRAPRRSVGVSSSPLSVPGGGRPGLASPESSSSGRPRQMPLNPRGCRERLLLRGGLWKQGVHTCCCLWPSLSGSRPTATHRSRCSGASACLPTHLLPASRLQHHLLVVGPRLTTAHWFFSCGDQVPGATGAQKGLVTLLQAPRVPQASQPPPIAVIGRAGSLFSSSSSAPGVPHLRPRGLGPTTRPRGLPPPHARIPAPAGPPSPRGRYAAIGAPLLQPLLPLYHRARVEFHTPGPHVSHLWPPHHLSCLVHSTRESAPWSRARWAAPASAAILAAKLAWSSAGVRTLP